MSQGFSSNGSVIVPMDHKKLSHPGFSAVASHIARKEGISNKRAGAILASASRNASPAAKKANPALKKVH